MEHDHLQRAGEEEQRRGTPPSPGSGPARSRPRPGRSAQPRVAAPRAPARPRAPAPPGPGARGRPGRRSPSQEHQLGAEARAHRHQQARDRPGRASPESSSSESTKSTDAEERLPVRRSESHERRSASDGSSSASSKACSTFGPPVCAIAVRECPRGGDPARRGSRPRRRARGSVTSAGTLALRHDLEARVHHVPAHDALGVRVEDATGWRRLAARPRAAAAPRRRAPSPRRRRRRDRWR